MNQETLTTHPVSPLDFKNVEAEVIGAEGLGKFVQISEKETDGLNVIIEFDEAAALRDWLSRLPQVAPAPVHPSLLAEAAALLARSPDDRTGAFLREIVRLGGAP